MGTGAVFQHDCVHFSPFIATFSGYADFFQLLRFFSDHNPSAVSHETLARKVLFLSMFGAKEPQFGHL